MSERDLNCEQCQSYWLGQAAQRDGLGYYTQSFEWHGFNFRVDIAESILCDLPRQPIPLDRASAAGCGLLIGEEIAADQVRFVNDEHLAHLPAEVLKQPGILCPAVERADTEGLDPLASWILIDGGHRMTRLFREGAEAVLVWPLTIMESLLCAGFTIEAAQAFILRNKRAFYHWTPDELALAGIFPVEESDANSQVVLVERSRV